MIAASIRNSDLFDKDEVLVRRGGQTLCGFASSRAILFFFFLLAKVQRRKGIVVRSV